MADLSPTFTDFESLTDSEQRVMYALVKKAMSSNEISQGTGISYSYLIRILKSLQNKGFIRRQGSGKEFSYHVIKYPETLINEGLVPEFKIKLGAEHYTINEAMTKIQDFKPPVIELRNIIGTVWIRSLRKDRGLPQEEPDAFSLRYLLIKKIAELKILLSIAEQLANLPIWNDKPHNWKMIQDTSSPNTIKGREEISRRMFERFLKGEFE